MRHRSNDLRNIVQTLTARGVRIEFVKESLTFVGDDSPMAVLLLSVMGAFAEFERSLIKERQREGIALAKQKGLYKGRRPSLDQEQIDELRQRVDFGEAKTAVARSMGVSRETLYHGHLQSTDGMPSRSSVRSGMRASWRVAAAMLTDR